MRRKSSKQRDRIMEFLASAEGHLTAEEIYKNMKEQGEPISLATVYRNLGILEEQHKIRKIAHPQDGYCYDKSTIPHHHLHCVCCGRILDLVLPYRQTLDVEIAAATGAKVYSHSIMAEGICPDCQKQDIVK